jgi:hypothetical protein
MLKQYNCITCNASFEAYTERKFCSTKCQNDKKYFEFIETWKNGDVDGMRGKTSTSQHIRRYLFEKYNNSCSECGWSKVNPHTQKIPLELEHVDGDYTNNKEENLKLLCPNCHSLTSTWKGANKKQGRPRAKYYRGS